MRKVRKHLPLNVQMGYNLEARMRGLVFRNGLARKIWNNPHRYTRAGNPTYVSWAARLEGIWPWVVVRMTVNDLVGVFHDERQ